ncbi:MAG: tRNA (adenosine(37)-N6)-dimethylallyltransferase MiaA [Bacteriovoracaceae bacterium]
MKRKVVIIAGPTATGKTSLSIRLAKIHQGVVVNFDSLLFYKELAIGTARPTIEEMQGVPHFLVGTDSIGEPLNANQFAKKAKEIIENRPLHEPIFLVGGSGFYLQALMSGMYEDTSTPNTIKEKSDLLYKEKGITPFLELLKEHDSLSLDRLHANDHYRLRRAVEYFWTTGKAISLARLDHEQVKKENIHGWDTLTLYLDIPKVEHYPYIIERTKKMLQLGLIDEVRSVLANGFTGKEKPMQSIGYKEAQRYLEGIYSLEQCEEEIFIATRQLAKSQRTWFKGQNLKSHHPLLDDGFLFDKVQQFLKSN